jgi:hypothetical protein
VGGRPAQSLSTIHGALVSHPEILDYGIGYWLHRQAELLTEQLQWGTAANQSPSPEVSGR